MKRNVVLLLALLMFGFSWAQKNKFESTMASKKLAMTYKNIKQGDKDEFYQQYYWLVKMEELKTYPHLASIKPAILYQFVREIYPPVDKKKLTDSEKELRAAADKALGYFITRKDYENPNFMYNLESYVDPKGTEYFTRVDPERVIEVIKKQVYAFTSHNKKSNKERTYYLWIDEDKFRVMSLVPPTTDTKFYTTLRNLLPNYTISTLLPEVKKGKKSDKNDADYFYIIPFSDGVENVEYKTKDFQTYTITRYRTADGEWKDYNTGKKK